MKIKEIVLMCAIAACICAQTQAKIIYVDDDAIGTNDGSNWENAYTYLRDALTAADSDEMEKPLEIRVAQGTYKPNQGLLPIVPPSTEGRPTPGVWPADEEEGAKFPLINGVTIKGSYAGIAESDPNTRDIKYYKSILSGDLNGDDIEVDDPCDLLYEPSLIDNCIHVLYSYHNDANAILDGFTIKGGNCAGIASSGASGGAGMIIIKGSPAIINCTFTNNTAYESGGGLLIRDYGNPTLINCTFTKNYASSGAGVYLWILHSVSNWEGNPTFMNCTFSNNYSIYEGAGMRNMGRNIMMSNCSFTGNFSESTGGGLYTSGNVELNNCTFHGNWSQYDSAIAKSNSSIINIINSIIWNGQDAISDSNSSTLTISNSDIEGGWEGEGNIDLDPLFVDPNNGDYHLRSQAGRWDSSIQSWVQDDVTSPCIDAGNPNSPIGLEPFPNSSYLNMGAYGGTSEASKTYFGEPLCETIVAGDINGDCKVDMLDMEILLFHWLEEH